MATTVGVDALLRLVEAVPGQYRGMVMTAGLAGLRLGEVAGLRLSEIDLNARTTTVVHQLDRKGELGPAKTDGSVATLRVARR